MKRMLKNRKGIISEALPWIIISISVLAILMITIFVLKGKGVTVIDSIKNLFKFLDASNTQCMNQVKIQLHVLEVLKKSFESQIIILINSLPVGSVTLAYCVKRITFFNDVPFFISENITNENKTNKKNE